MGQQSKSGRTDQWSLQHRRLQQKSQLEFFDPLNRLSFLMILLLAAVPLVLFENPRASAASSSAPAATTIPSQGLVCFSQVADSCPALPAQFSVPLGSTFTAYVVVQGSQAFNGFNIWFQYPYGILNATGTSLAGSVLPGAK